MPITNAVLTTAVNAIADVTIRNVLSGIVGATDTTQQDSVANAITLGTGPVDPARHAVMLAHLYLGMKVNANIVNLKTVVGGWAAGDCTKELDAVHKSYVERIDEIAKSKGASYFGSVVLAPSFYRYASSEEKRVARLAITTSQAMALKAVIAVTAVRANATAEVKKRYEDHFGTFETLRFNKVKGNIGKIYKALTTKPVLLYYRGSKVAGGIDDSADNSGAAASTGSVAETWTDTQLTNMASLHSYKNEAKCSAVTHIWMGSAAFSTGASGPTSTGGKRSVSGSMSIAGTILHEISHYACATADEANAVCTGWAGNKCYGNTNVGLLAAADTTQACNNADSYRYYFEAFQGV